MLKISYNNISLTRGDTAIINFELENYELQSGDTVVLTAKKSVDTSEIAFQKSLDFDTMQFTIANADTKNLSYGKYYYDIQLTTSDGDIYTVISPHTLTLEAEVTW